jgi:SHAQKYF class myb-like DNA-binding protein
MSGRQGDGAAAGIAWSPAWSLFPLQAQTMLEQLDVPMDSGSKLSPRKNTQYFGNDYTKAPASDAEQDDEEGLAGDGGRSELRTGRWTAEEHELFVDGYKRHGKSWKDIAALVVTRTPEQIRTHAQKFFQNKQGSDTHEHCDHVFTERFPPSLIG